MFLLYHVDGQVSFTWGSDGAGCTMGRGQAVRGSVMLWAIFFWEFCVYGIHVDVTLTRTTYLNTVANQEHLFMETVLADGSGLFQQDNAHCKKCSGMVFGTWQRL